MMVAVGSLRVRGERENEGRKRVSLLRTNTKRDDVPHPAGSTASLAKWAPVAHASSGAAASA
jgi:hypothetical protein